MGNLENFLKEKKDMNIYRICPNCSNYNLFFRENLINEIYLYKYFTYCEECEKKFSLKSNEINNSKIFFKKENECKLDE